MDHALNQFEVTLFIIFQLLLVWSLFFLVIRIAIPVCFLILLAWNSSLHIFTLRLCLSLVIRYISWRQQIEKSKTTESMSFFFRQDFYCVALASLELCRPGCLKLPDMLRFAEIRGVYHHGRMILLFDPIC